MLEIQNCLEHLNLCFLKIVSDFGQFYKIRRYSDFLHYGVLGVFLDYGDDL
jgi:hypothetical protein